MSYHNPEQGERYKIARLHAGLSQKDAAKALGYASSSVLSSIEKGAIDPTASMIRAMAELYGTTPNRLLNMEETDFVSLEGLSESQASSVRTVAEELWKANSKSGR